MGSQSWFTAATLVRLKRLKASAMSSRRNTLAERHALGDAHIPLEESRAGVAIAAQNAVAARGRSDAGNFEAGEIVGEALVGGRKSRAGDEGRSGARTNGRPRLRSAQIEARIRAGDDVERPAGRKLDDGRHGEVRDEMPPQIFTAVGSASLKNRAGDPAVPLVVIGIAALEEREAAVLRLESGLQVGGVVDGMRPSVTGEQFQVRARNA